MNGTKSRRLVLIPPELEEHAAGFVRIARNGDEDRVVLLLPVTGDGLALTPDEAKTMAWAMLDLADSLARGCSCLRCKALVSAARLEGESRTMVHDMATGVEYPAGETPKKDRN